MSIKTKIAAIALAALVTTGGVAATTSQAQAGYKGAGIGLGIAAGVLAGAAIASNGYGYGYGYRRCGWVRQYDAYGYYIGRVNTCAF